MLAFRVVFLIAVLVGLLAAIAVSSSDLQRRQPTATQATLPEPVFAPTTRVTASLPTTRTLEARLGDMFVLRWTPKVSDVVELDAFGFEQGVAGGVPITLRIVAAREGTFRVRLRRQDKDLVTLRVTPRTLRDAPATEDDTISYATTVGR